MDPAVVLMWRRRLAAAGTVMVLVAVAATGLAIGYDELSPTPVFLWIGAGCVWTARRLVPRASSAAWAAAGIVCFFAGPLAFS